MKKRLNSRPNFKKKEAQLDASKRKERNGKLIAFGILVEEILQSDDTQTTNILKEKTHIHLK